MRFVSKKALFSREKITKLEKKTPKKNPQKKKTEKKSPKYIFIKGPPTTCERKSPKSKPPFSEIRK